MRLHHWPLRFHSAISHLGQSLLEASRASHDCQSGCHTCFRTAVVVVNAVLYSELRMGFLLLQAVHAALASIVRARNAQMETSLGEIELVPLNAGVEVGGD